LNKQPPRRLASPRRLVVTTSQDSQDRHVQTTRRQDSPWNGSRQSDLGTQTDEEEEDHSMDSSANSTTTSELRNGPIVYTRNGHEEGPISPLSVGGDWVQESPKCKSTMTTRKSPRAKIPEKRLTPSNSSVPSALLGVVFESAEEEIVFEALSDAGSNQPPTPAKCLHESDSLSEEPLFFHDIPLTPSFDVEQQEKHRQSRPKIFNFDHPKLENTLMGEESERSKSHSRSSWRYCLGSNLFQRYSPSVRYETMVGDHQEDHCIEAEAIKVETMTTLSAEPEFPESVRPATAWCRVLRAICWTFVVAMTLGMGAIGILLLTTDVIVISGGKANTSYSPTSANMTVPSKQDLFLTVIGSISGFDTLNDHASPAYQAYRWITTKDPAHLDPKTATYIEIMERYIAALLFFSTNGEYWYNDMNFLSEKPICEWNEVLEVGNPGKKVPQGILCNTDERVVRIEILQNNMTGTVPWELAGLEELQSLKFPHNKLSGSLPTKLGLLANLRFMDLVNNHLTGALPTEFGWLGQVRQIKLRLNNLDGTIPQAFGNMSNLKHLDISNNHLRGKLPLNLGKLATLEYLDISHNQLDGIVPSTLSSGHYTMLDVSFNNFYGNLDKDFCVITNGTSNIWADCGGQDARIQCSCCLCCDYETGCALPPSNHTGK
jgi:Leucine rich repeat